MDTISMQDVRRNLPDFLRRIANGQKITVIYHSEPLVTLQSASEPNAGKTPQQTMQDFLGVAAKARQTATHTLDPNKSYKQLYIETIAKKHTTV